MRNVTKHFTTTIVVDQAPQEVFDAIINVNKWWSENIDGSAARVGDEFTYRYQNVHHSRLRVTKVVPRREVVWRVLDNYFDFTKDKSEWIDTEIVFAISQNDGKSELHFTHDGLIPEYECFDLCTNAWRFYINDSLRSLITTGRGKPNPREERPPADGHDADALSTPVERGAGRLIPSGHG